ncbi:class I SAM-dependent methyltransferase [Roseateles depolymerans]|uniref:Methyltransferase type 12 n=1 Tax=Roseateles depolymerans TaxID=76731 RepID=A0A0U3M8P9_9BURK|nr:class I SAM-dependent methyltransferase [Roseateles depolymerans]ALV04973.1 Methyltransferase type 12 [Roseateles depolymerans]REG15015.1 methyltransferase family protein [Roseateles depolymerans]
METRSPASLPLHFSGAGPGPQSADGCSVELYRRSAYAGEIELLKPWLPPGTTVLELGCGTGRLTHRLLEFGCRVTGVDNSADMLRHVSDAVQRVQADIETLQLDQRFDVVLLPSGMINHADSAVRRAFVAAAARHVAPEGRLILKRQPPHWLLSAQVGDVSRSEDGSMEVVSVERSPDPNPAPGSDPNSEGTQVRMTLRYRIGADTWTHAFSVIALEEAPIARLLQAQGFEPPEPLDAARLWLSARPRSLQGFLAPHQA